MSLWSRFLAHPVLSLGLMYVKKFNSYCQVLKKMHAKENWFLFSVSRCTIAEIMPPVKVYSLELEPVWFEVLCPSPWVERH